MPRRKKSARKPIEQYERTGKERLNNPPVGFLGDISRIEQAVEVGSVLSRCWFRGHHRLHGSLLPGIFRSPYTSDSFRAWRPDAELLAVNEFKRASPALTISTPAPDDDLGWLFLMQHHGAPTRLLDWTESVLVALHFAASWSDNEDGELFAVYPQALNKASDIEGLPLSWHPILQYMASEAANGPSEKMARSFGLSKVPENPVALLPPVSAPRIRAQLAAFTLHPAPDGGAPIENLISDERHFARYRVPGNKKWQLAQDLRALGITHHYLFPDLDGLSRHIVETLFVGHTLSFPPSFPMLQDTKTPHSIARNILKVKAREPLNDVEAANSSDEV